MRKIKIVTDSSSDIIAFEHVSFASAPLKIITKEKEYVDDEKLDVDDMVNSLEKYKGKSQTSCPNTSEWLTAFGDADDVFCVTITSGLSGSYNAACVAKRTYEETPGKRVFVIDSLSTGPEMRLIVEKLAEYITVGLEFDEICKKITDYQKHTGLFFMLKSVKNLANNGRISAIAAKIISIASISIVGRASDVGTLETSHKCRGELRALETLSEELYKFGLRGGKVCIGHCQNESAATKLKDLIEKKFNAVKIEIHKLRGLCSFYAERGGLIIGFEKF